MKVFSVHERPINRYNGEIYHPYLNVVTKYFELADDILYGFAGYNEVSEEKANKLEKVDNPNIHFIELGRVKGLSSLISGIRKNVSILEKSIEESDILVARLPSISGLQAIQIAKKLNKPYMVEVIGCAWDAYWNYGVKGKLFAPVFFLAVRRAIKNASHAVYVTDEFLQKRYPCKGKSIGASNVHISLTPDKVLEERLKKISNKKDNIVTLATAAGIENPVKGQQYVIQALAELNKGEKKYHYYLLGGGSPVRLKDEARKYNVEEYVHFVGQIKQEEVAKFLHNIYIYIQPSKQEGLPRALIEAMSQGCPAIGSNIAGIPELLDKECLFRKGNVKEIVNLLSSFTNDDLRRYAQHNFEKAKKYTFDQISDRRKEFFKEFKEDYNLHGES